MPNPVNFTAYIGSINFTQQTVSHIFTNSKHTITSNVIKVINYYKKMREKKKLTIDDIYKSLQDPNRSIPLDRSNMLTINVIKNNKKLYSCDNRRLCMLKILFNLGLFNGKVSCKHIRNCFHDSIPIRNDSELLIIMGDQPAKTIKQITDELKKIYKL